MTARKEIERLIARRRHFSNRKMAMWHVGTRFAKQKADAKDDLHSAILEGRDTMPLKDTIDALDSKRIRAYRLHRAYARLYSQVHTQICAIEGIVPAAPTHPDYVPTS